MSTETIRLITIRDGEKGEGGMEVGEEGDYIHTCQPIQFTGKKLKTI